MPCSGINIILETPLPSGQEWFFKGQTQSLRIALCLLKFTLLVSHNISVTVTENPDCFIVRDKASGPLAFFFLVCTRWSAMTHQTIFFPHCPVNQNLSSLYHFTHKSAFLCVCVCVCNKYLMHYNSVPTSVSGCSGWNFVLAHIRLRICGQRCQELPAAKIIAGHQSQGAHIPLHSGI